MFEQFKNLLKLQKEAKKIQSELRNLIIEAEGEGGKVKIEMNGEQKILKIDIDESLLSPSNKQRLEKIILNTIAEASKAVQKIIAQKGKSMLGDFSNFLK